MQVLLISHTYLPTHYRGKLRWLATEGGTTLTLAAVSRLRLPTGTQLVFENAPEPYDVAFPPILAFPNHNVLRLHRPDGLIRLFRRVQPDIVHVEAEPHSLVLAQCAMLKSLFGYRLLAFTWENLHRRGAGPLRWLEGFSLRRADLVIAGNQEAAGVLRWRGFQGTVQVIPQVGVDPTHFQGTTPSPALGALQKDGAVIGFVGRLVPEKGPDVLLEAAAGLTVACHLIYIGQGELRSALEAEACHRGLGDRVHFLGYMPYAEMPACLKGLDVLVLPSLTTSKWKEHYGHVLVEAMLAGVPVVGSDSGAIPEVIGDAGGIFPEGDALALREALARLLADPERRRRLAAVGRQRALAYFTDAAIARATLQAYRAAL